jgi:hypothetical protein
MMTMNDGQVCSSCADVGRLVHCGKCPVALCVADVATESGCLLRSELEAYAPGDSGFLCPPCARKEGKVFTVSEGEEGSK